MMRRITAAVLALMLLFTLLPANISAEETVIYEEGQTICISKKMQSYNPNAAKTEYPVKNGFMWVEKRNENGQRVDACTQLEHKHTKSCPNPCPSLVHTHDELGACDNYMGWVWEVVRDPNYKGWDYDPLAPENYEFSVCCIDPDGKHPMVGVGFILNRPATEEEKQDALEQLGIEITETSVLDSSQSPVTNENGYAYFAGECKETEAAGNATWTLVQNAAMFAPGGTYYETYRSNTVRWELDVTVHGDGTYTVNNISEPGADDDDQIAAAMAEEEFPLPQQGYNKEYRRLVMINEPVRVNLYIDARYVPRGVEEIKVAITGDNGFQDTATLTNGDMGWHYGYSNLVPGTYSIQAELEDYRVSYKVGYPGSDGRVTEEDLSVGNQLKIDRTQSNGFFEIHFGSMSNTVKLYSSDVDDGTPITDTKYGVYRGSEDPIFELDPQGESEIVITSDDWMSLLLANEELVSNEDINTLMNGGSIDVTVKQSRTPLFYEPSEEEYTFTVSKAEDGAEDPFVIIVKAAKGSQSVRYGENNEQIATFVNKKQDLSHGVSIRAYDEETGNGLPGGTYTLYENEEVKDTYVLEAESTGMDVYKFADYAMEKPDETQEFILKQTVAPNGYDLSEDAYKITVSMENGKPKVVVEKDQGVLAQIVQFFTGDDVEQDAFGRWKADFINKKKDNAGGELPTENAEISLTLDDVEINWNGCAEDGKQRSEFATREYEFVLSLLDDKGNWQDEPNTLKLRAGEATKTGTFSTALPVGTTYKVRAAGSENLFNVEISGDDQSGTEYVGTVERAESINLTTKLKYELKQGTYETPALHLVKVDAGDISKTLPGAVFVLKNAAGNTIGQPYTTTQTGAIDIVGVLKELGKYTLTETKAPDGYTQLSAPIDVEVKYQYTLDETDGEKAVRQDLVASAFHEKAVSLGSDGKYYIKNTKIQNPSKETAQVRLTLDGIQVKWNGCEEDSAMRSEAADMEYEFVLSWRDEKGVWKTDPNRLKLRSGNTTKTGTFRQEIPVGAAYRVSAAGSDNLFDVVFSNTAGGGEKNSVYEGTAEKAGIIDLTAKVKYELQRGEYSPDLYMIKVAARDTSKTLAGAKFSLKDEDAEVLETFQTKKDGRIEIIDLFDDYPSTYTLKEVKAPDEYIKLDTVIHITVDYAYTPETVNGKTVIVQDLVASASHPDVKLGADGWYYIKNTHMSDNPKTGDNFSVVLWSSMLAVSAAGLTVLLAGSKRRRKVR